MKEVLLSDLLSSVLSRESVHSLQRQIYEIVRRAVLDHTLVPGQKIPSSRQLALELGISRITVSLAYDRLVTESYLTATSGSGTFVAQTGAMPRAAPDQAAPARPWTSLSRRGEKLAKGPGGIPYHAGAFVPGVADATMFPFHIWKRLLTRHIARANLPLSGYAMEGAGYLPLREAIANYLGISRSVVCEPGQVIITSGTHQSIDLCARLLADVGDRALVENPCHWAFPSVLTAAGLHVDPLVLDEQGASLRASKLSKRTRLAAVSPSHQYPTGVVMPLSRRLELLERARKLGLWILEDDYDSEFRYDGAPLPSLQGLDTDGHVIYLGTFSKATFPGMRMSYMVVPQHLAPSFSAACVEIYRPGQLHTQAALADLISEGHLSQHIRRMRVEYAARQRLMRDAIEQEIGDTLTLSSAKSGLHVFGRLGKEVQIQRLRDEATRLGLILGKPRLVSDASSSYRNAIVLGFGGVSMEAIGPGVKKLAQAIEIASKPPHR
ncbi:MULTISPECIES: PLP-dependent aminotransferase family protein [unclassified Burkholderia]|uniref:MocR-like pyridoxine biosynthesis transcription factor PdxR n=1 Tax=unclassified Burkholderia TaxID=2613784 RepID=UPI000F56B9F6|nr:MULTISPECIES: PLP-dependent aminotransferase family protein [unclassified Burkholderia]RQR68751.1 PLP-dependent aminotransferase family protein [Burkholderia sp. Bp9012]RQR70070.1 PLP-dependent aminotransferase family protein [Burkholderia sp. Bp9011]RQR82984.1 PLP-dependent aminotransferase family protein [Burkholderia sp. Bp9010]RQZ39414.1 PLP-dependent aminotransferase family protein [Burkholderia sp. Bp9099]